MVGSKSESAFSRIEQIAAATDNIVAAINLQKLGECNWNALLWEADMRVELHRLLYEFEEQLGA